MNTFTLIHVLISLVAILAGFVFLFGLLVGQEYRGWTALFLATTVATSASGFFFPFRGVTPAVVTGILSLVVLAVALFAKYARDLAGGWRKAYVITSVFALYLNVFVLVVQAFQKVPALKNIAPTQNDPPFQLIQLGVLFVFITLGVLAVLRFRSQSAASGAPTKG